MGHLSYLGGHTVYSQKDLTSCNSSYLAESNNEILKVIYLYAGDKRLLINKILYFKKGIPKFKSFSVGKNKLNELRNILNNNLNYTNNEYLNNDISYFKSFDEFISFFARQLELCNLEKEKSLPFVTNINIIRYNYENYNDLYKNKTKIMNNEISINFILYLLRKSYHNLGHLNYDKRQIFKNAISAMIPFVVRLKKEHNNKYMQNMLLNNFINQLYNFINLCKEHQ